MNKTLILLLFSFICLMSYGQSKKSKNKHITDYDETYAVPAPIGKENKKALNSRKPRKAPVQTEYIYVGEEAPVADSATKFTGLIKYRITTDDPAELDSMLIWFGENKIRITLFTPGYLANQTFETIHIIDFHDSTMYVLDPRTKTYRKEHILARNAGTEFMLVNRKRTFKVLGIECPEYSGEMMLKDGERFEAACLISREHSFLGAVDYNFLNIQPVVYGYRIVLGWRTKSTENENTYIMAYQIEKGNVENLFDLSGYNPK